jgi:succinyl-diaminopimelate desuccinylase
VASLAERLAARTLELVDIPSESLHEDEIRAHVRALVPPTWTAETELADAALYAPPRRAGVPFLLLAGHYDTVPAQGNIPGRLTDDAVHGLGSTDMKGGLAVALELVRDLETAPPAAYDVGLLLFGKEELPQQHDPLPELFERSSLVHETALAVLLEPTDGVVHAGCVGSMSAELTFHGRSGHSARPWLADNAIERAVHGLGPIVTRERREAVVGGLSFWEVLSVTRIQAGIADNVIPDRAVAHLNLRYPPDRTPAAAEALLRSLVPDGAELEVVGDAPPGNVVTASPLLDALLAAGAATVEPKQAWTNVADFSVAGIDAVNFGPGHPPLAHTRDEHVRVAALVHAYETLARLVGLVAGPGAG